MSLLVKTLYSVSLMVKLAEVLGVLCMEVRIFVLLKIAGTWNPNLDWDHSVEEGD